MPKSKPFAKPTFPNSIVQDYGKAIIKEVNLIDNLIKEILYPQLDKITNTKSERLDSTVRLDIELKKLAGVDLVVELIRRIKSKFYGELIPDGQEPTQRLFTKSARRIAKTFMTRTEEFTEKKFVAEFENQTGTKPLARDLNVDIFLDESIARNVNLIKTLPNRYLSQVTDLVTDAVSKGQLTREVRKELFKIKETTKNSARLLARDQISKLTGVLNESRLRKLGVKEYIWRTVNDSRVRSLSNTNGVSSHAYLEGTLHKWSSDPVVVFKGKRAGTRHAPTEDFQCRCHAQGVYDDITGIEHPETKAARKKSIALGLL
jgi:SPP1 gp7 family putative phage head morphogenesis protein